MKQVLGAEGTGRTVALLDRLVPNSHARLQLLQEAGVTGTVVLRAPIPGEGLRTTTVRRSDDPALFQLLLGHFMARSRGGDPDLQVDQMQQLSHVGALVPPDRVASAVRFACDVDDPSWTGWRRRASGTGPAGTLAQPLLVNPTLEHLGPSKAGSRWTDASGAARLAAEREWVRVEAPGFRLRCLYSFAPHADALLRGLAPGLPPPGDLDDALVEHLHAVGILVTEEELLEDQCARTRLLDDARADLAARGYALLPHVIHPFQLAALRRYYRELIDQGYLPFGDVDWPLRYFAGNEPLARTFHHDLTGLIARVAGEAVKPSFLFFASYRSGSSLPPHRDRVQCEWSVSLQLDHVGPAPWPLHLEPLGSPEAVPIILGLGDMVVYRGREVRHYREPLAAGHESSFWFLFYVAQSFLGALE